MIRGFAAGSLALIVLYVVVQPQAAEATGSASNAAVAGLKRLLSPGVAGIGNHAKKTTKPASTTTGTTGPVTV